MRISEVKDCVKILINAGIIPELNYWCAYEYSEERILIKLDELTDRNSQEHINAFIGVYMLKNIDITSFDPHTRQKIKNIWTKIHDFKWESWKYVRAKSINCYLRNFIYLLDDPSLVSFIHRSGWSGDNTIYDIYRKSVISYVYSDYKPDKETLIRIIQIMLQLMCVDILDEDTVIDVAYAKRIVSLESYPWNLLADIGIDIQDCFDIKTDIREELTATITNNIKLLPREVECIKLRYINMLTFSDVGKELGVCGGRVGQILAKALRKIYHPSRLNIIRNILYRYSDDICKQAFVKLKYPGSDIRGALNVLREIKRYKRVNTGRELVSIVEGNAVYFKSFIEGTFLGEIEKLIGIANRVAMEENTGANKLNAYAALTLEELDLSVRTFNCLKRAGVNTVGDIISRTEEDFMCVRNLGKRSYDEIISVIEGFGLKLKDSE